MGYQKLQTYSNNVQIYLAKVQVMVQYGGFSFFMAKRPTYHF